MTNGVFNGPVKLSPVMFNTLVRTAEGSRNMLHAINAFNNLQERIGTLTPGQVDRLANSPVYELNRLAVLDSSVPTETALKLAEKWGRSTLALDAALTLQKRACIFMPEHLARMANSPVYELNRLAARDIFTPAATVVKLAEKWDDMLLVSDAVGTLRRKFGTFKPDELALMSSSSIDKIRRIAAKNIKSSWQ